MRHPFLRTLAGAGQVTDPNFENVTLLLHSDGTNGGQNNTFVDGSTNNFTITRNGNTTQGTFSPYGDNWSNHFDGTGDYLTFGTGVTLSGDFCAECWYYQTASPTTRSNVFGNDSNSGGNTNLQFSVTNTGGVTMVLSAQTVINNVGTAAVQNQWNHIAWVRSGTSCAIFVNGTRQGTGTSSVSDSICRRIGDAVSVAGYLPIGYISDARIVTGSSVYNPSSTTITVPSARLTAISGTQLLTCQSNRFRDASTNNFTITRNGDVSVQRFSPFSPTAAYAAGTIGGSGYFDGNGDWLEIASNAALQPSSSDFGMEFWLYLESLPASSVVRPLSKSAGTYPTGFEYSFYVSSTGQLNFQAYTTSLISLTSATSTIVAKCWYHIAIARSGNNYGLFANGSRVANQTVSGTIQSTSSAVAIGRILETGATQYITGYVCDVRIVKGSSVYDPTQTTLTVPTAPLTAITNTQLLCNFQNAAILDNAMMAVPETVGDAQISTSVKKYGTGALYFNNASNTGTSKLVLSSLNLAFGSGDFTVELWAYPTSLWNYQTLISSRPDNGGYADAFSIVFNSVGQIIVYSNESDGLTSSWNVVTTNNWQHIAVTRNGNTLRIFHNGTVVATNTSYTKTPTRTTYGIGQLPTGNQEAFTGYIDDLRITKGVARYTANFTAPTAAFPNL